MYETFQEATIREVREETGFEIDIIDKNRPDYVKDQIQEGKYHYLLVASSAVVVKEGDPVIEGRWFNYEEEFK